MKKVVLFGNGPIASAVYFMLTHESPYEIAGFTVDSQYIKGDKLFDLPVVPFTQVESAYPPTEYNMIIAVGYTRVNKLRAERYCQANAKGYQLISHISSTVIRTPGIEVGENCIVFANSIISAHVKIGNNVIVGAGTIIGHDCVINDHCFIGDHVTVGGGTTIGSYSFLGMSSTVRNKINVAKECVIGAGALILEDTQEKEVYVGKPADLLPISSDQLPIS